MLARKTSLTGLPGGTGGGSLSGGLTVGGTGGGGGVSGSASQSTGIDPLAPMTGTLKSNFGHVLACRQFHAQKPYAFNIKKFCCSLYGCLVFCYRRGSLEHSWS